MVGKLLDWNTLQSLDGKQTVIVCNYSEGRIRTRLILGNFSSRDEAWNWCKSKGVKHKIFYNKDNNPIELQVKLLRLDKIVREYITTRPKYTSAILI